MSITSKNESDETPQRNRPTEQADTLVRQQTMLGRWAAQVTRGRRVLDASTPVGPATTELILGAAEVVAVTPKTAVAQAGRDLIGPDVKIYQANLADLPFDDGSFGAVVAVPIEVEDDILYNALREFRRILNKDGLLLLSCCDTPRDQPPNDGDRSENKMLDSLNGTFEYVKVLENWVQLNAIFVPSRAASMTIHSTNLPAEWARFPNMIFVASNGPIPDGDVTGSVSIPFDLARWQEHNTRQATLVRHHQAQANLLQQSRNDRDQILRSLLDAEQLLAGEYDRRTQRGELPTSSMTAEEELEAVRQQLASTSSQLAALQATISWRLTRPLRSLRRYLG